jgi:hypothetical protein
MSRRKGEAIPAKKERPAKRQKKDTMEEKADEVQWCILVQDETGSMVESRHGKGEDAARSAFHDICHRQRDEGEGDAEGRVHLAIEGKRVESNENEKPCPCPKCTIKFVKKLDDLLEDKNKNYWTKAIPKKADGSLDWDVLRTCPFCGSDKIYATMKHPGAPGRCNDCFVVRQRCIGCAIMYGPRVGDFKGDGQCPACGLSRRR